MSDNVISFETRDGVVGPGLRIKPDAVLDAAKGGLTDVLVLGYDADGQLYIAGSGDHREALWLMAMAKHWLLEQAATA